MNLRLAKLASGVALGALLLGGSSVAFAQTYNNPDGSGSVIPTTNMSASTSTGTTGTTGTTGSTTGTSGSTGATTGTSGTGSTVTPGIPNTGAGGDAATTLAVLSLSGLVVVGAAVYLLRKQRLA